MPPRHSHANRPTRLHTPSLVCRAVVLLFVSEEQRKKEIFSFFRTASPVGRCEINLPLPGPLPLCLGRVLTQFIGRRIADSAGLVSFHQSIKPVALADRRRSLPKLLSPVYNRATAELFSSLAKLSPWGPPPPSHGLLCYWSFYCLVN